jgi:NitT/TauT family transport system substrate-binding protein
MRLRVGTTQWPGFDVIYHAQSKQLFAARGLEVELVPFDNQQDAARAVMRGALDGAFASLWDTVQLDSGNDTPMFILVSNISRGADGIVARPGIRSVPELRGKRVSAKLGTVNHLILLEALRLHGMEPDAVEVVDVDNSIAEQMIRAGQIDAAAIWEPVMSRIAAEMGGRVIYTTRDVDSLIIDGMVSRKRVIAEKREAMTRLLMVWFDVMHAVSTDASEVYASAGQVAGVSGEQFGRDYQGLQPGDIPLNQHMFHEGRLAQAIVELGQLLRQNPQHGRAFRDDVAIEGRPVSAAIRDWKPMASR